MPRAIAALLLCSSFAVASGALGADGPGGANAGGQAAASTRSVPAGWQADRVEPVGYLALPSSHPFKLGIKRQGERWYLFVANGGTGKDPAKAAIFVVDVTIPAAPRLVATVPVPDGNGQVTVHGDLLIAGRQLPFGKLEGGRTFNSPYAGVPAQPTALASLYDISNPSVPRKLSDWITKGWGTHRNGYFGGRLAFMSARLDGFSGQTVLAMVDVGDPTAPKEVGRWWWPGQRDGEQAAAVPTGLHGAPTLSSDGTMLTMGYAPGFINLDIRDVAHPKVIGQLEFSPLSPAWMQAVHTVAPLGGGMFHVSSEPYKPGCGAEHEPLAAIVDNRDPAHPMLLSHYPRPVPPKGAPYTSFCDKDGRFGPHNVNTSYREEGAQQPNGLIYMTYFNAGLRIYDVSDPRAPVETGWFVPALGAFSAGFRGFEDVLVDTRGNAFLSDGHGGGLWVLRYVGAAPVAHALFSDDSAACKHRRGAGIDDSHARCRATSR